MVYSQLLSKVKKSSVIKFVNSLHYLALVTVGAVLSLVLFQDLRTNTKYTQTRRYFRFAKDEYIVRSYSLRIQKT